ncbi:MAG: hypothetical protein AAAB16_00680 [Pseudomonas sp.]|uniref:hypothetical protein n=1 Tax=Pseudomonas sp. TaxID=306 RepID=UPI0030F109FD
MADGAMGAIIWGTGILLKSTLAMLVIGKQAAQALVSPSPAVAAQQGVAAHSGPGNARYWCVTAGSYLQVFDL